MTGPACPDCGAGQGQTVVRHRDGCPLAAGVEAACDADREWLSAHPRADRYRRPVAAAELAEMHWAGYPVTADWTVIVHRAGPGQRVRQFCQPGPAA
jgi:hypothetical protein